MPYYKDPGKMDWTQNPMKMESIDQYRYWKYTPFQVEKDDKYIPIEQYRKDGMNMSERFNYDLHRKNIMNEPDYSGICIPPEEFELADYLKDRSQSAWTCSGGGSRAFTNCVGGLRGMHLNAKLKEHSLPKIKYLTGVSGGAWFTAMYSFASNKFSDDELLGVDYQTKFPLPEDLDTHSLSEVSETNALSPVVHHGPLSLLMCMNFFWNCPYWLTCSRPIQLSWQQWILESYLTTFDIPTDAYFGWSEEQSVKMMNEDRDTWRQSEEYKRMKEAYDSQDPCCSCCHGCCNEWKILCPLSYFCIVEFLGACCAGELSQSELCTCCFGPEACACCRQRTPCGKSCQRVPDPDEYLPDFTVTGASDEDNIATHDAWDKMEEGTGGGCRGKDGLIRRFLCSTACCTCHNTGTIDFYPALCGLIDCIYLKKNGCNKLQSKKDSKIRFFHQNVQIP